MSNKSAVAVPECLKKFEEELISFQREYVRVTANSLPNKLTDDPLGILSSKFLGKPSLPLKYDYPVDDKGKPMFLLAQINFSEVPNLEGFPTSGLLQLYLPTEDWYPEESAKILFIPEKELYEPSYEDFNFLSESSYTESPVWKIHQLHFSRSIDTGCGEDCQFDVSFDDQEYWGFEDSLEESEQSEFLEYFSCDGHKIGGYGGFTQGDVRENLAGAQDDIQLLQIDVDDDIMFGDSGVAHIFINPNSLKEGKFEHAYFYWDCC
ncbi:DUF1963 domain-containing protein [Vibrio profundum]|uniref:YwqG family protein n=1 Tax=Vibrio profundum TaxID=2910247 RepID=UPI003D109B4A